MKKHRIIILIKVAKVKSLKKISIGIKIALFNFIFLIYYLHVEID